MGRHQVSWGTPGQPAAAMVPRPRVELRAGWPALAALERDWRRLHGEDPHPVPSLAWEAVEALRAAGLCRGLPAALVLHGEGRPGGIVPLELHRTALGIPVARFLGEGVLDRHEPLLSTGWTGVDPLRVFAGLARRLGRQPILDLGPLRAGGSRASWLLENLGDRLGWTSLPGLREYRLDLHGGWNRVRLSLPLPLREDARRGLARARRRAPTGVRVFRAREAGVVREILDLAPGRTPGSLPARLPGDMAERGARRGKVIVGRLVHGGRLVAGVLAWMENHQATLLAVRDDGRLGGIHPRRVLLVELVRHLATRETCTRLLLPPMPGDHGLGLVPREQLRLVGTLRAGIARVLAGVGLHLGGGRRLLLPLAPWPGPAARAARTLGRSRRRTRAPWRPVSRPAAVPPSFPVEDAGVPAAPLHPAEI